MRSFTHFGADHPAASSLHGGKLRVSVLIPVTANKSFSAESRALICGSNNGALEIGLILCPLSRLMVVGYSLVPRACLHSFFFFFFYQV